MHSLAHPNSGSDGNSRGGGAGMGAPEGASHSRHCSSGQVNHSEGGGVAVSAPSLAVSAGCGFDDDCLNAFLAAALLRVVQNVVPV